MRIYVSDMYGVWVPKKTEGVAYQEENKINQMNKGTIKNQRNYAIFANSSNYKLVWRGRWLAGPFGIHSLDFY